MPTSIAIINSMRIVPNWLGSDWPKTPSAIAQLPSHAERTVFFFKTISLQITATNPNMQSTENSDMILFIGNQLIISVAARPQRHPIKKDTDVFMPDLTGSPIIKYIPAQANETQPKVIPKSALTAAQIGGSKATPIAVGSTSSTLFLICKSSHTFYQLSRCSLYISGKMAARFVNSFMLWLNRNRGPASGNFAPSGKTLTSFPF